MLETIRVTCPFCGERFEALVDASGGETEYIEDCPVCCRPIEMHLRTDVSGDIDSLDVDRDE